jgi:transglutaminase-like putative cysteine protease
MLGGEVSTSGDVGVHRGVSIAPAPVWAEAAPFVRPDRMAPELVEGGLCFWKIDDYVDWLGPEPVHFRRAVQEVVGSQGLRRASTFDATFEPSFERLVIHHVRVLRGGEVRELASPEHLQVFRRERDLERAVYDGRLTINLIIPDLRVGDIVDACFSSVGANPALGGLLDARATLQWGVPVAHRRFRLYAQRDRNLAFRRWGLAPAYTETPLKKGNLLRTWTADGVEPFEYEADTPSWWFGHAQLLATDALSWSQVADVFRGGYDSAGPLPAELEAKLGPIAAEPDPKVRAAAALRLVQRELRYLSVGIGVGGFRPRPLDEIWKTRFGDCKDHSRLLTVLLKRLDVDACPALVNTDIGWDLRDGPPFARAFDHCIVRARVGGKAFWLDATRRGQRGRLERVAQARFGWALPLEEGADLEWMGEDEPLTIFEQHERVVFGPGLASPADFDITAVFRGEAADVMRDQLENEGLRALMKSNQAYYEDLFGPLEEAARATVEDREDENEILLTFHCRLLEPWRPTDDDGQVSFSTFDEIVGMSLTVPRSRKRTMPIGLGPPRRAIQTTVLELPEPWDADQWDERWDVGGAVSAACSARLSKDRRRVDLAASVEIRERALQPELASQLFDATDKATRSATMTLTRAVQSGEFAGPARPRRIWWGLSVPGLGLLVVVLLAAYSIWRTGGL